MLPNRCRWLASVPLFVALLPVSSLADITYNRRIESVVVTRTLGAKTFMINVSGRIGTRDTEAQDLSQEFRLSVDGAPLDSFLIAANKPSGGCIPDIGDPTHCVGSCPPLTVCAYTGAYGSPVSPPYCHCEYIVSESYGPYPLVPGGTVTVLLEAAPGSLAEQYTADDVMLASVPPILPGLSGLGAGLLPIALGAGGMAAILMRSARARGRKRQES
jgi:hypothetical protein